MDELEAHHNRLNCYRLTASGVAAIEGVRR